MPKRQSIIKTIIEKEGLPKKLGLLGFLLICLLISACKSGKSLTELNLRKKSPRFLLKKMDENIVDVDWISAKARITYIDERQTRKVTANIRLRKDSVIWMNVKKASIEAARILIDKDSIYIINRLDKQYLITDLNYIRSNYNLPADFDILQALLLGNPVFLIDNKWQSTILKSQYVLSTASGFRLEDFYLNGLSFLLEKMIFKDTLDSRDLSVTLAGHQKVANNQNFSYIRKISITDKSIGKVDVGIKFLKVEADIPKNIPFNIPDHYEKMHE